MDVAKLKEDWIGLEFDSVEFEMKQEEARGSEELIVVRPCRCQDRAGVVPHPRGVGLVRVDAGCDEPVIGEEADVEDG